MSEKSGWPMPVSERHEPFSIKRCARCNDPEFRIDGYCTIYCQDMAEVETENATLQNQVEELREVFREIWDFTHISAEMDGEAADALLIIRKLAFEAGLEAE